MKNKDVGQYNIPSFIVHTDVLPELSSSPSSPVDGLPRNQLPLNQSATNQRARGHSRLTASRLGLTVGHADRPCSRKGTEKQLGNEDWAAC